MKTVQQVGNQPYRITLPLTAVIVVAACTAIVLVMLVHLRFLASYPPVFIDEAWNSNAAWNMLQTGVNFETMHAGTLDQFGAAWIRMPFLGDLPLSISFAALGLGLFQARLTSWVFGIVLLAMTALVGRRMYGNIPGVLAALLLSLSAVFLQASHYARADIMLAAVVMAAFYLALIGIEEDKGWANLLAGLLLGVALDIHQNSILFAPGLALIYLAAYRKEFLQKKATWLCALGGVLGIAYFVALRILPSPSAYSSLFGLFFSVTHVLPIQTMDIRSLLVSLKDEIGRYHFYENNLDFAVIGASTLYLLARRRKADLYLLIFAGTAFTMFVLFVGNKHDIYAILFYPFFMLMVAEALTSLIAASDNGEPRRLFAGGLLALMLVNSGVHLARPALQNRDYDYYAVTREIQTVVDPNARVLGMPHWWFGLADTDYRSTLNLSFYHVFNGYSVTEGLDAIHPDYIIVDDNLRGLLVDEGYFALNSGFDIYKLPRHEFEQYLTQHGTKVYEFSNPWHGYFEVFAIN